MKVGFDNSFNLSADVKIYKVPVSVSLSKSTSTASDSVKQHTQVEVYMFQEGGDVAALGKALGSTNGEDAPIATCSLNNLAACDSAISNAINYLASDTFINGIKTQPAILNQALRPFWELEPHLFALSTSEITLGITTARTNLVNAYLQHAADLSKAQQLLSSSLTAAHKASLQSLVTRLTSEIDQIRSTALICYSDLSQCEAKTKQLIANLVVYQPSLLQSYPDDGLLLNLPFEKTTVSSLLLLNSRPFAAELYIDKDYGSPDYNGYHYQVINMDSPQIWNDAISSAIIYGTGCTLTLYRDPNYGGVSSSFGVGGISFLKDTAVGHDSASSAKLSCPKPTETTLDASGNKNNAAVYGAVLDNLSSG